MSEKGANYRGCQTTTRTGHTCQNWSEQSPNAHKVTPANYPEGGLEKNYCRNPDGTSSIWCYTKNGPRWALCDALEGPTPAPTPSICPESMSGIGTDYRGCQTKTRAGNTCQKWGEQSPNKHTYAPASYPEAGLEKNYCRNPDPDDGTPGIWCYTTNGPRWDYCDVLD